MLVPLSPLVEIHHLVNPSKLFDLEGFFHFRHIKLFNINKFNNKNQFN